MERASANILLKQYFSEGTDAFLPHVAVNCVVFGYRHPHLKVLVLKLPGQNLWSLPGGYVKKEEPIDDAAYRNLEMTKVEKVVLKQIQAFGDPFRVTAFSGLNNIEGEEEKDIMQWAMQRFITIVYYGLVDLRAGEKTPLSSIPKCIWMNIYEPEEMIQDHASIIAETRKLLINELLNFPVAENLLPSTFTMNELRGVYESILNRSIDRGTFRRKILNLGIVEKVDKRKDAVGRPSHLFQFNKEKYQRFLAEETKFGF